MERAASWQEAPSTSYSLDQILVTTVDVLLNTLTTVYELLNTPSIYVN